MIIWTGRSTINLIIPILALSNFRSNLVARWEYIPGSEVFLVWSQGQTAVDGTEGRLFNILENNLNFNEIHNIFLLKFTYRFLL